MTLRLAVTWGREIVTTTAEARTATDGHLGAWPQQNGQEAQFERVFQLFHNPSDTCCSLSVSGSHSAGHTVMLHQVQLINN